MNKSLNLKYAGLLLLLPLSSITQGMLSASADAPASAQVWGPGSAGLQFQAKPAKSTFATNEPIIVNLEIRNTTNQLRGFGDRGYVLKEFDINLTDSTGRTIPLTRYGQSVQNLQIPEFSFKNMFMGLRPGDEAEYHFWVSRLYDMTLPGTYHVTIKRSIKFATDKPPVEVVSNTASIQVVEPGNAFNTPETNLEVPLIRPRKDEDAK